MYGTEKFGTIRYADKNPANNFEEEHYQDLTHMIASFMLEKLEMYQLYEAQGYGVGQLLYDLADVIDQCFSETATWGLTRWEKVFGIKTNLSLTYEQRRGIIRAKIQGQGTTTKRMIQEAAAAFSGSDVEIIEDNPGGCFIVRFIGIKGIPRNMQDFLDYLDEMKPAHLAYSIEYRYTVWNEMMIYPWNMDGDKTWNDLRILKEDTK